MESTISKKPQYRDEHIQQLPFQHFHGRIYWNTKFKQTVFKLTVWKRYVDDIFSLWDISKPDIVAFFAEQVNLHHPTMKFTAEISENETFFLETVVYQSTTFSEKWEKALLYTYWEILTKKLCRKYSYAN